jgi:hypothetical protein
MSLTSEDENREHDLPLNESLYKDNFTSKDNLIKISSSKDKYRNKNKDKCKGRQYKDISRDKVKITHKGHVPGQRYDYLSLRNILQEEMDKPITLAQAEVIGSGLVDMFSALYFEDEL